MSPEQRQEVSDLRTRLLDAFSEEDFDKTAKLHCYVVKRVCLLSNPVRHRGCPCLE